jgi:endonuclease/exonuclease/phosphatase family metal-dependent hydrolase
MRVISYNTGRNEGLYWRRLERIARELAELKAEIILLQECFSSESVDADTAKFIADALSYSCALLPARRKAREFEGRPVESTSGLAILTNGQIIETSSVALPTGAADGERFSQLVVAELNGIKIQLINIHFTYLPGLDGDSLRLAQLMATLNAIQPRGDVAFNIIGGDFNAIPGVGSLGFLKQDMRFDFGPQAPETYPPTYIGGLGNWAPCRPLAVDHILVFNVPGKKGSIPKIVNRYLALNELQAALNGYMSDHAAVVIEVA